MAPNNFDGQSLFGSGSLGCSLESFEEACELLPPLTKNILTCTKTAKTALGKGCKGRQSAPAGTTKQGHPVLKKATKAAISLEDLIQEPALGKCIVEEDN